jgi:hypothetical protein
MQPTPRPSVARCVKLSVADIRAILRRVYILPGKRPGFVKC